MLSFSIARPRGFYRFEQASALAPDVRMRTTPYWDYLES